MLSSFSNRIFPSDWNCKKCNYRIFNSKDRCTKCNLDRHGNSVRKNDDWNCKGCNFLIYGSKKMCLKCGLNRDGVYVNKKFNDWNCPNLCNFLVFANKNKCFKCNIFKPINKEEKEENKEDEDENKLCVVCMSNSKNSVFIHGDEAHQCCCYECGKMIFESTKKCPMCRKTIESIVKTFI